MTELPLPASVEGAMKEAGRIVKRGKRRAVKQGHSEDSGVLDLTMEEWMRLKQLGHPVTSS